MNNKRIYCGVADCDGLDSIYPKGQLDEKRIESLTLQAMANRHRHAVFFYIELDVKGAEKVYALLKQTGKGVRERALELLKEEADKLELPIGMGMAHSWRMIPNPELNPFYKKGE